MNNNSFNKFHKNFSWIVAFLFALSAILTLKFTPFSDPNSVNIPFMVVLGIWFLFIFFYGIYHRQISGAIYIIYLTLRKERTRILILDDEVEWIERHTQNLENLLGENFEFRVFLRYQDAQNYAESHPDVIFCIIDEDLGNKVSYTGKDTINEINRNRAFINKLQVFFITNTVRKNHQQKVNANQQGIFARPWNRLKSALSGNSPMEVNEKARYDLKYKGLHNGSKIYEVYGKNHIFDEATQQDQPTAQVIYRQIEAKIRRGWLLGLFDNQQP